MDILGLKENSKIYAYYLKETKELYSWTPVKSIAKEFEFQRDMHKFYKKKFEAYELSSEFFKLYNENELIDDILFDGETDFNFVLTIEESNAISSDASFMLDIVAYLNHHLHNEFEYTKYLHSILNNINYTKEQARTGVFKHINTFKIFCELYSNTI